MTEPGTGPASAAAQPGGTMPGEPGGVSARHVQPGSTSAGSTATETRTTASQAAVPQQVGQHSAADTRIEATAERDQYAYGTGGNMIAAAAGRSWGAVLLGGLLMIAVGVMILVWPAATLTIVAVLLGAALVVSGLMRLYEGFTASADSGGMRAAYVVIGLLAVLAGLYLIRHHALSLFLVAFLTGVYFIVHGIGDLGVAASAQVPHRGLRAVLGVLSLAAGIIMVVWPALTLVLLLSITGAWLILYGLVLAGLAFGLRRTAKGTPSTRRSAPVLAASS